MPQRGHPQVSGEFLYLVQQEDWEQVCNLVHFPDVAKLFLRVGIAPNTTEETCASWLASLLAQPFLAILRQDVSALPQAIKYAK